MRKVLTASMTTLLLLAGIAGAQMKQRNTAPTPPPGSVASTTNPSIYVKGATPTTGQAQIISMDEATKLFKADKAVFVDVRSNEQFGYGHIKGAVNIPGSQIVSRLKELPPNKTIIAYCACSAEQSSAHAVQQLNAHGVKRAFALKGGWNEWKTKSLPIAVGPK
jgi:rhodanese-related sulfurtransferase